MTPEEKLDALPVRILGAVERAAEARRRAAETLRDLIGPAPGRPRAGQGDKGKGADHASFPKE